MAKKLISVWLSLTILLFSSISIYADENVQGDFFIKNIVINGETIDNNQLQFPFFLYKNTTYFPLTPEMGKILGLNIEMDFESRTLKLMKTDPTLSNITQQWQKNNSEDITTQAISDAKVYVYEVETLNLDGESEDGTTVTNDEVVQDDLDEMTEDENAVSNQKIDLTFMGIPQLSVKELNLGDLPILTIGKIVYLPIKVLTGEDGLGWDAYYDFYTGIYISTKEGVSAQSYWNQAESNYNKGLVNYIRTCNSSYTASKALNLVMIFKEAAETYNIDERILVAVAHKESTFNANARGSGGALGMMQVMPSTGARYGLSEAQLLDPEVSINFGAMYLSERIAAYGGDVTKGFSAYNQGSVAVNRGSYSTRYANRIITAINELNSYLTSNGYGLGN